MNVSKEMVSVEGVREASGSVNSNDPLVDLFYVLMRDHLPTGTLATIARQLTVSTTTFTNGWLANYAKHLVKAICGELKGTRDVETLDGVRPVVRWFAHQMELKLRANDHKNNKRSYNPSALMERLKQESKELEAAIGAGQSYGVLMTEAADIANFAMMIADGVGIIPIGVWNTGTTIAEGNVEDDSTDQP